MYPRITIEIDKLKDNAREIVQMSKANGIEYITAVVKAFAGDVFVTKSLLGTGIKNIGDSRIQNLILYKTLPIKKMLLRIPMISEIEDVVRYADISLNSELETITLLDKEARRQGKIHEIIVMFDLGDLREGIYYTDDYLGTIEQIKQMKYIKMLGIGTNLTCYGGLVPSKTILSRLVDIKNNIENKLDIKLEIISGGNSSSLFLYGKNEIPEVINHLRLGESILFGKETAYSTEIKGLHHNIYKLEAEIIECMTKPSYPDGETSINSFGEIPEIEDKGIIKRAILAIGKQDLILDNLSPIDKKVHILGGSSDHLICDITGTDYKLGDILSFDINYPALVHLMNSSYVDKFYK